MQPDELDARAAKDEEQDHMSMQLFVEASDRDQVDYDPPHPLAGLDTETLASFNLKQIRSALGISQQQIADKLSEDRAAGHHDVKLSQTQIAKIERGERPWRLNELIAIAAALGVEMEEFFKAQSAANDALMLVRTAKLKYQRAEARVEDAREALRLALRASYEAENELIKAAARHQVWDEKVLTLLTLRGVRKWWQEHMSSLGLPGAKEAKESDERSEYAVAFVAEEWIRITKEETGKEPEKPVQELPQLDL